ncbi:MAG: hypothetical protein QM811_26925 [Pirellulales bacterium]
MRYRLRTLFILFAIVAIAATAAKHVFRPSVLELVQAYHHAVDQAEYDRASVLADRIAAELPPDDPLGRYLVAQARMLVALDTPTTSQRPFAFEGCVIPDSNDVDLPEIDFPPPHFWRTRPP